MIDARAAHASRARQLVLLAALVGAVASQFSADQSLLLRRPDRHRDQHHPRVSLNLVNGYTGQFSLGHAGFMAVGAYTVGVAHAFDWRRCSARVVGADVHHVVLFAGALLVGGIAAALAGLLVGVPSLRLKGDYLAIVTLGFGEIIACVIQNTDALGGAARAWRHRAATRTSSGPSPSRRSRFTSS